METRWLEPWSSHHVPSVWPTLEFHFAQLCSKEQSPGGGKITYMYLYYMQYFHFSSCFLKINVLFYYGSMVMTLCWANSSLTAFACQGFVDPNQECDWGYKACCLANYQIELQPFCSLATYHKNKAAAINNKDLFRLSLARLLARQCEK